MEKSGPGYLVNFQYGRVGNALQSGSKTPKPVDEASALKIYDKLVKEKMAKGYAEKEGKGSGFSGPAVTEKKTHGIFPQLLNSIEESEVERLIQNDAYVAQEKFDGQRRMVISKDEKITGLNKKGQEVQLPDSFEGCVYNKCTLDGEIIGNKLYVFDVLFLDTISIKEHRLDHRLKLLESLNHTNSIEKVKTAYTTSEKRKLYNELKARNAEGIVFKRKDSEYVAGRPNSGGAHLKFKFYKEASFIVKDFTKGKRSVGLELLNENKERVFMGKCTIPPNKEIPAIGDVVEVRYLYAYLGGAIFQPTFKEKRDDVDFRECLTSQLIYKEGSEEED